VSCGTGTLTSAAGSNSSGDCYVPPGHFIESTGSAFVGKVCPIDTYGRDANTFGLVASECTKCPEFSGTSATTQTSSAACLTDPGYGWYDGSVLKCDFAYYSTGGGQEECKFCGAGYNTSNANLDTVGIEGADAASDCRVAAGFYINPANATGGVSQCPQGQYKPEIGDVACTSCPSGTTTTLTAGATEVSDCDACDPGYGGVIADLDNPSCGICGSGSYAAGFVKGGLACATCPNPSNFDGTMVSRKVRPRARSAGARRRRRLRAA
jgi:hypothetical protein